jgi:hypothetical protein
VIRRCGFFELSIWYSRQLKIAPGDQGAFFSLPAFNAPADSFALAEPPI